MMEYGVEHPCPQTRHLERPLAGGEHVLVVLGDSITCGTRFTPTKYYPALLEKLLNAHSREPWRVLNAGYPGDTVVQGALRYARDVAPFRPEVLCISFGLNDGNPRRSQADVQRELLWWAERRFWAWALVTLQGWGRRLGLFRVKRENSLQGLPRVPQRLFVRVLTDLVQRGRRQGAEVHLLPLVPVSRKVLPEGRWQLYREYDGLIRQVGRQLNVPVVCWEAREDPFLPEVMRLSDGVHLSEKGEAWLARRLYQHLREWSPRCRALLHSSAKFAKTMP